MLLRLLSSDRVARQDGSCRISSRPRGSLSTGPGRTPRTIAAWVCLLQLALAGVSFAQPTRMGIEVTLDLDGATVPRETVIRVLRRDSSIAKTVSPYAFSDLPRFGIRLTAADGFAEGDPIAFRVVIPPADSFQARVAGGDLQFHATPSGQPLSVEFCTLFRNHLPQFRLTLPDTVISEGETYRYAVYARDIDADTVRYRLVDAPAGAALNQYNGRFTWTPSYDQAGVYRIRVEATDGIEVSRARPSIVRVLNVNRPPEVQSVVADTTVPEGDTARVVVRARDADGDTLLYRLSCPEINLRLESSDGQFRWSPGFHDAGLRTLRITVSDGAATTDAPPVLVTIRHVNRPPRFRPYVGDTAIAEGDTVCIALTADDPDGLPIRYRGVEMPEGMHLDSSGGLRWQPTFLQAGTYPVTVIATDDSLSDTARVVFRVRNIDRPPRAVRLRDTRLAKMLNLSEISSPIRFAWSRSTDPDPDDTVRYAVHLWGGTLDTLFAAVRDTVVSIILRALVQENSAYRWTVLATDGQLQCPAADTGLIETGPFLSSREEDLLQRPRAYTLEQNFPNPFNPLTSIRFTLPVRSFVRLAIYNMLGERMLTLVAEEKAAGVHDIAFDAGAWPSGVYMFKMEAHPVDVGPWKDFISTKKMILVK